MKSSGSRPSRPPRYLSFTERRFPQSLAGPGYDADIPIYDESELPELIKRFEIDFVFFAYSDISHAELMHKSSMVQAAGASFVMLGPDQTQLVATKPVVSVTATRTGAGKSPLTQWLARLLTDQGKSVAVIRHPMPYGNLEMQRVQRFATTADLVAHECTIEEREEYEPYVDMGIPIYAGVDYQGILDESSVKQISFCGTGAITTFHSFDLTWISSWWMHCGPVTKSTTSLER